MKSQIKFAALFFLLGLNSYAQSKENKQFHGTSCVKNCYAIDQNGETQPVSSEIVGADLVVIIDYTFNRIRVVQTLQSGNRVVFNYTKFIEKPGVWMLKSDNGFVYFVESDIEGNISRDGSLIIGLYAPEDEIQCFFKLTDLVLE